MMKTTQALVERKLSSISLLEYLTKTVADPKIYWKRQDFAALDKIRKKSSERLKKFAFS